MAVAEWLEGVAKSFDNPVPNAAGPVAADPNAAGPVAADPNAAGLVAADPNPNAAGANAAGPAVASPSRIPRPKPKTSNQTLPPPNP